MGLLSSSSSSSSKTVFNNRQTQQGLLNLAAGNKSKLNVDGITVERMDADVAKEAINASTEASEAAQRTARELGTDAFALSEDVTARGLDFGRDALRSNERTTEKAMGTAERVSRDALSEALDFGEGALAETGRTRRQALEVSERATGNALEFAANQTRSEAGQAMEEVAKWGGLAALGLGLAFVMKG